MSIRDYLSRVLDALRTEARKAMVASSPWYKFLKGKYDESEEKREELEERNSQLEKRDARRKRHLDQLRDRISNISLGRQREERKYFLAVSTLKSELDGRYAEINALSRKLSEAITERERQKAEYEEALAERARQYGEEREELERTIEGLRKNVEERGTLARLSSKALRERGLADLIGFSKKIYQSGMLKGVFPIVIDSRGKICYAPEKAGKLFEEELEGRNYRDFLRKEEVIRFFNRPEVQEARIGISLGEERYKMELYVMKIPFMEDVRGKQINLGTVLCIRETAWMDRVWKLGVKTAARQIAEEESTKKRAEHIQGAIDIIKKERLKKSGD